MLFNLHLLRRYLGARRCGALVDGDQILLALVYPRAYPIEHAVARNLERLQLGPGSLRFTLRARA